MLVWRLTAGVLQLAGCSEQAVLKLSDRLRYIRLSDVRGSLEPKQPGPGVDGGSDMEDFFCLLHKAGYDGRITIEGLGADLALGQASGENGSAAASCMGQKRQVL